jgi:hypothetical protein
MLVVTHQFLIRNLHQGGFDGTINIEVHECRCRSLAHHPTLPYPWPNEDWTKTDEYRRLEQIREVPGVKYASNARGGYFVIVVDAKWRKVEPLVLQAIESVNRFAPSR